MKLAHFSDIHVCEFPLRGGFALKRLAAVANYSLLGRGRHFQGSEARVAELLRDVDAQGVDHAVCTGDLTGVSGEGEFRRVAALFGKRLQEPERFTCLPGNHDRYTTGAHGLFERSFSSLCEGGSFPFVKAVGPQVSLIAIDVAHPTSVVDSSGWVGRAQLERLRAMLTDRSLADRFVVLALHYGLYRASGRRDRRTHRLRDDLELIALLDDERVTTDLVIHGHMHRPSIVSTRRRRVVNAGSATDLHVKHCGYNVYEIDPSNFCIRISRREWDGAQRRYRANPASPLNQVLTTRRG